jgi:hypothetical protein
MLGLFKRTKIAKWETNLLKGVIRLLPPDYHSLEKQIDEGLFRGILLNASDLPGYNAFTFNPNVYEKFENKKTEDYTIKGIKVFNIKSETYLDYNIHISSGVISGYSIVGAKKFEIDENNIDVRNLRKVYRKNIDYQEIEPYLSVEEKKIVNQSDLYKVVLGNEVYFHIKDLEDGDFIGMDIEKNIYQITHDPFEIKLIGSDLASVLNA